MVCKENKAKDEKDTTTKSASSTGKDCQINICCAHAVDHFLGNPLVECGMWKTTRRTYNIYIYKYIYYCLRYTKLLYMCPPILRILQAKTICYMVCKENAAKEMKGTTTKSASSAGKDCQIHICCTHAVDHFLGNPVLECGICTLKTTRIT